MHMKRRTETISVFGESARQKKDKFDGDKIERGRLLLHANAMLMYERDTPASWGCCWP